MSREPVDRSVRCHHWTTEKVEVEDAEFRQCSGKIPTTCRSALEWRPWLDEDAVFYVSPKWLCEPTTVFTSSDDDFLPVAAVGSIRSQRRSGWELSRACRPKCSLYVACLPSKMDDFLILVCDKKGCRICTSTVLILLELACLGWAPLWTHRIRVRLNCGKSFAIIIAVATFD